ncbi:MAG: alpha/beta hydrolase family protein [Gammaproteobacteria bacterium]
MRELQRKITVGPDTKVSSAWAVPGSYKGDSALILAHGAGKDMHEPLLSFVHTELARRGVLTVKFNFPYKERGGKAPDRPAVLEATWRAVIDAVRKDEKLAPSRLFIGGKSMGGRIASHLAAADNACDGLVFLGYPLHPPNKTERIRANHLTDIACPMLFLQGDRDALCKLDLLRPVLKGLSARVSLHVIEGGDHSFKVLKRLGRDEAEIRDEIIDVTSQWLTSHD